MAIFLFLSKWKIVLELKLSSELELCRMLCPELFLSNSHQEGESGEAVVSGAVVKRRRWGSVDDTTGAVSRQLVGSPFFLV